MSELRSERIDAERAEAVTCAVCGGRTDRDPAQYLSACQCGVKETYAATDQRTPISICITGPVYLDDRAVQEKLEKIEREQESFKLFFKRTLPATGGVVGGAVVHLAFGNWFAGAAVLAAWPAVVVAGWYLAYGREARKRRKDFPKARVL